jgi:hypothetical protein
MRGWIVVATLCASSGCDRASARPAGGPSWGPGIEVEASTGEGEGTARLDLGTQEPLPDLPGGDSSSGSGGSSTGEGDSSSGSSTTGEAPGGTSSGGEGSSTGGSSTGGSSSGGEGPAVCGDGVCEASERAPCWATPKEAWCFGDCYTAPECASDCPCTPEAAAVKNFCAADPAPACAATAPGGYCEQGDNVQGFYAWLAKCG